MKAKRVPERQAVRSVAAHRSSWGPHHESWRTVPLTACATRPHVSRHLRVLLTLLLCACSKPDTKPVAAVPDAGAPTAKLISVGPRLFSNQTSQPLSIYGEGLKPGMTLELGAPISRQLPLVVWDGQHAFARLAGNFPITGGFSETVVEARVSNAEGVAKLRVINDTTFPDLTSLARSADGSTLFALSSTTDELFAIDVATHKVTRIPTDDGPSSLSTWVDAEKNEWLVITHQYAGSLVLVQTHAVTTRKMVPAPSYVAGAVVKGDRLFVAEQARDTIVALELPSGRELWRTPVAPNPKPMVIAGDALVVGSQAAGSLELLALADGAVRSTFEPGPGTPIIGGHTAKYSKQVMNGKAPRALLYAAKTDSLFVSSIGPNIGPNEDKMEVSMNGGVGVVSTKKGWQRHLGFGAGVTEGLAFDEARGLLYAGDVGVGLVRVLDVKKLAADATASKALLQELAMIPPSDFPRIRADEDFSVKGRAGPSLHSGPRSLVLSNDNKTLYVLERFTGSIAVVDVTIAGKAVWKEQWKVVDPLTQPTRRMGQVLYHADLGRTAMSCDACHIDGHSEGVLYEKTMPLRIYRSTTVRGSRETPPFFTPASTSSMGETAKMVGGRNRFHNPDPSSKEIEALTLYASLIPTLPNPFVSESGAPVEKLTLPDGHEGRPREGLKLFEGKAQCSTCHPSPLFTLDQSDATRGRFIDVGTPHFMPLREAQQNTVFQGFGTPSLIGSWDVFPMLTTGLAGLSVQPDGAVRVDTRFPLRTAVEKWAPAHGRADLLTPQERDDLLAYVLSL
ncbi:MAG: MtsA protein [Archangium gephyra]|uniref:MtsA protein n=1 Tax=Archangium gephyra TaxID=48 RepID=A0A2W5VNC6_9BACT|nr:MAG: MtsA protein [Archangium gephyra]